MATKKDIRTHYTMPGTENSGLPVQMQMSPYASLAYAMDPSGNVTALTGYPSMYPHVLNVNPRRSLDASLYAVPAPNMEFSNALMNLILDRIQNSGRGSGTGSSGGSGSGSTTAQPAAQASPASAASSAASTAAAMTLGAVNRGGPPPTNTNRPSGPAAPAMAAAPLYMITGKTARPVAALPDVNPAPSPLPAPAPAFMVAGKTAFPLSNAPALPAAMPSAVSHAPAAPLPPAMPSAVSHGNALSQATGLPLATDPIAMTPFNGTEYLAAENPVTVPSAAQESSISDLLSAYWTLTGMQPAQALQSIMTGMMPGAIAGAIQNPMTAPPMLPSFLPGPMGIPIPMLMP